MSQACQRTWRQALKRLLTLVGPGGVGKTRLALDVAFRAADAFAGGVWFVDLAPVTDPALLLPSIARTLDVRESGEQSLRDRLIGALSGGRSLVVLDNVEQVVSAAPAIADLLGARDGEVAVPQRWMGQLVEPRWLTRLAELLLETGREPVEREAGPE